MVNNVKWQNKYLSTFILLYFNLNQIKWWFLSSIMKYACLSSKLCISWWHKSDIQGGSVSVSFILLLVGRMTWFCKLQIYDLYLFWQKFVLIALSHSISLYNICAHPHLHIHCNPATPTDWPGSHKRIYPKQPGRLMAIPVADHLTHDYAASPVVTILGWMTANNLKKGFKQTGLRHVNMETMIESFGTKHIVFCLYATAIIIVICGGAHCLTTASQSFPISFQLSLKSVRHPSVVRQIQRKPHTIAIVIAITIHPATNIKVRLYNGTICIQMLSFYYHVTISKLKA